MQGVLEIWAIGNVHADDRGIAPASHLAIIPDDEQHAHPRNVTRKVGEDLIAPGRIERHFRVDTRCHAQQGTRRIDDLALRGNAAASEIDDLAAGNRGAFDAGSFQPAYAFDHQRSDRQQGDDDQPGADAENGPVAPLLLRRRRGQGSGRLCLKIRHSDDPRPRSRK